MDDFGIIGIVTLRCIRCLFHSIYLCALQRRSTKQEIETETETSRNGYPHFHSFTFTVQVYPNLLLHLHLHSRKYSNQMNR